MEVILVKDVDNLGMKNEVVRVKNGYARNYLLPHKLAIPATPGNVEGMKRKIDKAEARRKERMDKARVLAEVFNGVNLTVRKKAGREGRLFGSVTPQEVAELLQAKAGTIDEAKDFVVDRKKLQINEAIKNLGSYFFQLKLETGIVASVKLEVLPVDELPKVEAPAPARKKAAEAEEAVEAEAPESDEAEIEGDEETETPEA